MKRILKITIKCFFSIGIILIWTLLISFMLVACYDSTQNAGKVIYFPKRVFNWIGK